MIIVNEKQRPTSNFILNHLYRGSKGFWESRRKVERERGERGKNGRKELFIMDGKREKSGKIRNNAQYFAITKALGVRN